jgi:hypothetical protein
MSFTHESETVRASIALQSGLSVEENSRIFAAIRSKGGVKQDTGVSEDFTRQMGKSSGANLEFHAFSFPDKTHRSEVEAVFNVLRGRHSSLYGFELKDRMGETFGAGKKANIPVFHA